MATKPSGIESDISEFKDIRAVEKFCLCLISEGQTSKEIAFILAMTEERVEYHLKSIENKLNASNRVEAVMIALTYNLFMIVS